MFGSMCGISFECMNDKVLYVKCCIESKALSVGAGKKYTSKLIIKILTFMSYCFISIKYNANSLAKGI